MSFVEVEHARKQLKNFLPPTPLLRCKSLEHLLGLSTRLFLKCEHFQPTNSFKARGAAYALLQMSEKEKQLGVVTRSSGNFAQAIAFFSYHLGIPCTVVMPENVPNIKHMRTRTYTEQVILHGLTHREGDEKARAISESTGAVLLSPYNHKDVIFGGGTIALEILEEQAEIDHFFCPVGGGGLLSGASIALKHKSPHSSIFAAEPQGAPDFYLSLKSGKKEEYTMQNTIADGLKTPSVGDLNWPILQSNVDEAVLVSEEQIKKAMRLLYEHLGWIIEPSGATSFAALIEQSERIRGGNTVCVITGSKVRVEDFFTWIEESKFHSKEITCIAR